MTTDPITPETPDPTAPETPDREADPIVPSPDKGPANPDRENGDDGAPDRVEEVERS